MTNLIIQVSDLDGTKGFVINGDPDGDDFGYTVSAGDFNGDGYSDLIIGDYDASRPGGDYEGVTYVVFGKSDGFAASIDATSLDGTNGFRLFGWDPYEYSGVSVSTAGDFNGDGVDDLIIGTRVYGTDYNSGSPWTAPDADYPGAVYVVFGKTAGFASSIDLGALNGTDGFRIDGMLDDSDLAYTYGSVASAGDVNGDGFDDIIVGAYEYDTPNGSYTGAAFVIFGKSGGFAAVETFPNLANGTDGFRIDGRASSDEFGYAVSSAGDVNGDGFDDIIIAAPDDYFGGDSGAAYVVFGKNGGFAARIDASSLDGTNGFPFYPLVEGGQVYGVASGDVNGDGFDDVILGVNDVDTPWGETGLVVVVFGKSDGFTADDFDAEPDGINVFAIYSSDTSDVEFADYGTSVAAADLNGDGIDDILVGAWDAGADSDGALYVIFGKSGGFDPLIDVEEMTGVEGFRLDADPDINQYFGTGVSSAGDVNGDGYEDAIIGDAGNDGSAIVLFGGNFLSFDLPPADDDFGSVTGDYFVNAAEAGSASVSGAATAVGQTVTVTVSDGTSPDVTGTATTAADGTWTVSGLDLSGFADGDLTVTAVMTVNGVDSNRPSITVELDTVAASLTGPALSPESDSGTSSSDGVTSDATPTISFTAESGAAIEIDWGNGAGFVAAGTGTGSSQTATLGTAYATDGVKTIQVRATDEAGNATTRSTTVTIDTTDPTIRSADVIWTTAGGTALRFGGVLTADESVTWSVIGGADGDLFTINAATGALAFSAAAVAGDYTVELQAEDAAGNTSTEEVSVKVVAASDFSLGTARADRLNVGDKSSVIDAGDGSDSIKAGNGDNVIFAGDGRNTVKAGHGDNFVTAGGEADTIRLGDGDNEIHAGGGRNTIETGHGLNLVLGGDSEDTIRVGDGDNEIRAGEGRNTVTAGDGDNLVVTGDDKDFIEVGDGDNEIRAGDGKNTIKAGDGNNTIVTGDDEDVIRFGRGDNEVSSGAGDDRIHAGAGDDRINAGAGDDLIHLGKFDDEDVLVFSASNNGDDRVMDFDVDADLIDLSLTSATGFDDVIVTSDRSGRNAIIEIDGHSGSMMLVGVAADAITADNFLLLS